MQSSLSTTPMFVKINIQAESTHLNNFQLINEVDFICPKWRYYALIKKKQKRELISSRKMQSSLSTTPIFMKINIQEESTHLKNFQLINEVDFICPKWRYYALN
ncbi:uncharacterized protein OCT59_011863 [Rhizophagus irregularis]|uniref:uncharacterized protein n=1 Tax=Rhizophagus irregularis TaxID=588596 RepID=UPI00333054C4|nr:hypothetical protein OCT59_011863 [Rhizophagus irregularis]